MSNQTPSLSLDIAGKVVAITGASSGIGEATALRLAQHGAILALGARRTDRLEAIATRIRNEGGDVFVQALDVTRRDDVEAFVNATIARFGRVDVLVNNAGVMPLSRMADLKVDEWDRMVDVNVKGVLYGIGAVLPSMNERGAGQIINVSSVAGRQVFATAAVYCATKFAVHALSEGLRQESPFLRVTTIAPGAVESELTSTISDPAMKREVDEVFRKDMLPADAIARAIAFAIGQPADVDVNELVVRPTAQAY
ncbi:SDR family oxidoreductase [Lysobacter soli]|uniref:SDR family NAD(P)-dependent oxidoreductase n=1 Tax=Lysobacter soli TaxID=453783 RepID=A0A3D8VJ99_9GAMM|nr:SDR family oxidoreductase [Lysobacter soli]MDG2518506.1 SDR family oxidoreductase [Lysobacter soli]RDY69211.1 SDR family NAD(P)-dependent oxidoreductase [Lysobacter soli]UTA53047.1 SDR family oxidoreductase [Lysobacter soli]